MKALIMMGASGAGKTRYVAKVRRTISDVPVVVSSNAYFEREGLYKFDPRKLQEAHNECLRGWLEALHEGRHVVVDNTNTTTKEIAPYISTALAYGAEIMIVYVRGSLDSCFERNEHDTPLSVIEAQLYNLDGLLRHWPHYWPRVHSV